MPRVVILHFKITNCYWPTSIVNQDIEKNVSSYWGIDFGRECLLNIIFYKIPKEDKEMQKLLKRGKKCFTSSEPCFSLIIIEVIVWSLGNFNTMLLTSIPSFWIIYCIVKYGYRGVYSCKINSFKSLASYLGTCFWMIRHILL